MVPTRIVVALHTAFSASTTRTSSTQRPTEHSSRNCVRCCRKPPNSSMSRTTSVGRSAVGGKWRAKDWKAAKRTEAS
eukprot:15485645-Alexandrium_andersonii.AAC.1